MGRWQQGQLRKNLQGAFWQARPRRHAHPPPRLAPPSGPPRACALAHTARCSTSCCFSLSMMLFCSISYRSNPARSLPRAAGGGQLRQR